MVGVGQRTIVASVQLQCVTCNHTACMHDAEVLEQVPLLLRRQHYPALPRFATGAELHFDRYLSVILESLDVGACPPFTSPVVSATLHAGLCISKGRSRLSSRGRTKKSSRSEGTRLTVSTRSFLITKKHRRGACESVGVFQQNIWR